MGSDARLDPVPGGEYRVRMPDGFEAAGCYVTVDPPHQVSFTWGFADEMAAAKTKNPHGHSEATSPSVMPAGSTTVTVTLEDGGDDATLVTLRHDDLPTPELRDGHQVAWDTYLPRLAIAAAGGRCRCGPAQLTSVRARGKCGKFRYFNGHRGTCHRNLSLVA